MLGSRVLVLNQNYQPLSVCSAQKAIVLLYLGKAEMIEHNHEVVHTVSTAMPLPSIVRLNWLIKRPHRRILLTRKNIIKRDMHTCQYCGRKDGALTVAGGPHAKCFPDDCSRFFDLTVKECDRELVADILKRQFDPGSILSSENPPVRFPSVEARLPEIKIAAPEVEVPDIHVGSAASSIAQLGEEAEKKKAEEEARKKLAQSKKGRKGKGKKGGRS